MKRREAIKGLGLSFGVLLVGPSALSILQSCSSEYGPVWEPVFFEKDQVQLINKITDIILPKTSDSPGATEVNVPQFIDKFINEVFEAEDKDTMIKGMANISTKLLAKKETVNLNDVGSEDIEPLLAEILKKSKEEEEEIWKTYNLAKETESSISDQSANYVTLNNIRGLSIYAYKNSELVGEEILAYRPVPGKQEGCIDISETDGKAYSL